MKKFLLALVLIFAGSSLGYANPYLQQLQKVCSQNVWGQMTCWMVVEEGYNYGRDQAVELYNNPPQVEIPQGQMEYYDYGAANSTPYYFNQNQGSGCNHFLYNC